MTSKHTDGGITNLRESPNTDDHTAYLRDTVLNNQPNSYASAGNLQTVKVFYKRLHSECKDPAKLEKADKMLQHRVLPGVPDGLVGADGEKIRLYARYIMQVLQNRNGVVVDSHHADWGRDNNIGLYDIHSPLAMAKKEKSGTTRFEGEGPAGKGGTRVLPDVSVCLRMFPDSQQSRPVTLPHDYGMRISRTVGRCCIMLPPCGRTPVRTVSPYPNRALREPRPRRSNPGSILKPDSSATRLSRGPIGSRVNTFPVTSTGLRSFEVY